jgi:N-acetylglucosaminyldiphosphoundecaprenol N-acetyl-beta-D-mannosaminyltransferase
MDRDAGQELRPAAAHSSIARVDVLGVGVSAIDMDQAVTEVTRWIEEREQHYVCITGVHGVMESQRDPELLAIHNASGLTTPDGMPLVWAGRRAGMTHMRRVCALAAERGWSCFFYGAAEGVPELLAERLAERFPGLKVAGTMSPPFRPLTPEEDARVVERINAAAPDILWVGLSTPKQERWMAAHVARLTVPVLVGVGAAFDIHAGRLPQAPSWMQSSGLEWLYRLYREPRRLWRRYLRNNPRFVLAIVRRPPRIMATLPGMSRLIGHPCAFLPVPGHAPTVTDSLPADGQGATARGGR